MTKEKKTFGGLFKNHRKALGLTLREFCIQNGLDPGNLSRLERGLAPPPQGERLNSYAEMLGLVAETDAWYEFLDIAAAERGKIPEDLQTEEVLEKLPILFRTLRVQRVSDDGLNDLVKLVKGKRKR